MDLSHDDHSPTQGPSVLPREGREDTQPTSPHRKPPPPTFITMPSSGAPPAQSQSDGSHSLPTTPHPLPASLNITSPAPIDAPSSVQPISQSGPIAGPSRQQSPGESSEDNPELGEPTPRVLRVSRPRDDQRRMTGSVGQDPRVEMVGTKESIRRPARAFSYDSRAARQGERPVTMGPGNGVGFGIGSGPMDQMPDAMRSHKSIIDWNVPVVGVNGDAVHREKTVAERLQPTLDAAQIEKVRYAMRAKWSGFALNAVIGMQVLLGALTTGIAASGNGGHVGIPILGGLSTLAASYLARSRGSGEPEVSTAKCKDLEAFIRECEAFMLDKGHLIGPEYDLVLERYRGRFEGIMGNGPNGIGDPLQEKTSPPV